MNENTATTGAPAVPSTPKAIAEKKAKAPAKKPAAKADKKAKTKAKPTKKAAKKAKADGEPTTKGPGALKQYAPGYIRDTEHKTQSGNASVHCGDETAQKLLGKSLDDCYKIVAKVIDEPEADLRKRYKNLNVGMQRMNLGNRMRGVLNAK